MKVLIVLAVAVACVAADVSHLDIDHATILKSTYDRAPEGPFQYAYETSNGIYAEVNGELKKVEHAEVPSLVFNGGHKYVAPDGTPVELLFQADETGYHPVGDHIPTPHPIPDVIVRAIAWAKEHPYKEQ